mgnify:CR=1 FL=1|tara:strand:- start:5601 stop:7730 length:2130 start_codon:yes stop_codon:yes gene_type:complete
MNSYIGLYKARFAASLFFAVQSTAALSQALYDDTSVSALGTPGFINMPSGQMLPDGELALTANVFRETQYLTGSFQITPWALGTFRYSYFGDLNGPIRQGRLDRSFDVVFRLVEETDRRPSLTVGLQDFGGTGVLASEYVAMAKTFADGRLVASGGIGWGRLGTRNGFDNPLSFLGSHFSKKRDVSIGTVGEAGSLSAGDWFTGDAALFGALSYRLSDRISAAIEYSSDAYVVETERTSFAQKTPLNVSLSYHLKNGTEASFYLLHGAEIGFKVNVPITPQKTKFPSGIEEAPPALMPRQTQAALSWDANSVRQKDSVLSVALKDQGITLEGITVEGGTATVRIINGRYPAEAQALGRTARVLANQLPADITTFRLEATANGITTSRTTVRRSDLEALEYDLDGSWRSFARADFEDAAQSEAAAITGIYPKFDWRITPYLDPSLFDPDKPVRADLGVQVAASFTPMRGLVLSGAMRQPVAGTLDEISRPSNSVLPHVRTDSGEYAKQSDLEIKYLTADYFFRPGKNLYGRVTAGYLETMYGGVSGELLWKPVNGPLALGAELNYVKKRDFDQMFGFQDYDVVTGHASAYYDFGGGYLGQVDVGRYLAGDYGATFSLDREFDNGFRVGAFFTLTDVSFDDFGEGSFDKGIRFSVPVDWLTGSATQGGYGTTIRPVVRDGGARLDVGNRLYGMVRNTHTSELEDRWGKFWR